jgi:hypothetical protein
VSVEQLAEVGLAQPRVDVRADLDAEDLGDFRRGPEPPGEIDLAVASEAEQPLDAVARFGLRAEDDLTGRQRRVSLAETFAQGQAAVGRRSNPAEAYP